LEPIESIKRMDAILDLSIPTVPAEPEWPAAEFIVGNPPFAGSRKVRKHLGDDYINALRGVYKDRIDGGVDYCCYWFEKARNRIVLSATRRAGLLATQSIRKGASQKVIASIKETGDMFFGVSDRDWIQDGASVHVSMVGFDDGTEKERFLDGARVTNINVDLTSLVDVTIAKKINEGVAFQGVIPDGPFEILPEMAEEMLKSGGNPSGQANSDVIKRWADVETLVQTRNEQWIIDFGCKPEKGVAAKYQKPFAQTELHVQKARQDRGNVAGANTFWKYTRPRPALRNAIDLLPEPRYIATARHSKHLIFIWVDATWLPTDATVVFVTSNNYDFGILHSRVHETWVRRLGSQVREAESGFRYTHTTCFETFPFPKPTSAQREAIAAAARELDQLRNNWLNPLEWTTTEVLEFPGTVGGSWDRYIDSATVAERQTGGGEMIRVGTVKYPRIVPKDEQSAKELKKRTFTNLYNERPTWLDLAHKKLDAEVFAAYGWSPAMTDDELLAALLELNLQRAGEERAKQ
jgi:hypothetical protein